MRAAADLGLSVPGDLSIIAHDDAQPGLPAAEHAPPLTVTHAPLRDACAPLAEALIAHIGGTSAHALQRCDRAEMIVRGSTAPVSVGGDTPWVTDGP